MFSKTMRQDVLNNSANIEFHDIDEQCEGFDTLHSEYPQKRHS